MDTPEGWKLVPVEPTPEMMEVYKRWHEQGRGYMNVSIWKAMLAVAPHPERTPATEDR